MLLRFRSLLFVACVACCFLAAPLQLAQGQTLAPPATQEAVPSISAQEFKTLIAEKKPLYILDVRGQEEYDAGHIDNAVLIPLNTLPNHTRELPNDKKMIVYCGSGKRSAQAVALLRAEGYADAFSLSGGYKGLLELQKAEK